MALRLGDSHSFIPSSRAKKGGDEKVAEPVDKAGKFGVCLSPSPRGVKGSFLSRITKAGK